jgi:hypothetical protein
MKYFSSLNYQGCLCQSSYLVAEWQFNIEGNGSVFVFVAVPKLRNEVRLTDTNAD